MQTTRAVITRFGGPEVIEWREEELPDPGPGEVAIEHGAIGLNFIDTYHRTGLYPVELASGLGLEAAGRIEAVGDGVSHLSEGDRVVYMGPGLGAYSTHRIMPAAAMFKLPDSVPDDVAAAMFLKACTTEGLVDRCAHIKPGDTVLVHAAAGGVGLLMVQWLKQRGATVIGTVSTDAKAVSARGAGADHIVMYTSEDVAARVRDITDGAGVPTVFDGVGMATWEASLDSLSPRGLLVSFGNAGGAVDGVNLGILAQKGSVFVTRPTLMHYYATPHDRKTGSEAVFGMLASGKLDVTIGQTYPLSEAAQAHRDLSARKTTGSTVLLP